jgi:YegS/Rv2252/BmrU family lipid kinase
LPTVDEHAPFGELTVIVNPHAGDRRVGERIPELERSLRDRKLPYRLVTTGGAGDATEAARAALQDGARFLVAVGGDGTVHEVVQGMFGPDGPLVPDAVLGVVAAGSGCDLIRTFGMPEDTSRAGAHLVGNTTYPLDVVRMTLTGLDGETAVRYLVNVADVGLGAAVVRRADRLPRRLGQARYFIGFWLTLPRFKLQEVHVQADRRSYEGPAYDVVVANCQYYGGGMKISPKSYPGDGQIEVLAFTGPKSDAFTMIPRIYRGDHVPHPHVAELRARISATVESDPPLPIEADGELIGMSPVTFEVVAQPIQMKI